MSTEERDHAQRCDRCQRVDYSFRPTCPRCSILCPVGAVYCCECGTFLYLTTAELEELPTLTSSLPGCATTKSPTGRTDSSTGSPAHRSYLNGSNQGYSRRVKREL